LISAQFRDLKAQVEEFMQNITNRVNRIAGLCQNTSGNPTIEKEMALRHGDCNYKCIYIYL